MRSQLRRPVWTCLVALFPLVLVACGGDDSGKKIGSAGGTVTSADGRLILTIPPAALADDVSISIENASDAADPLVIPSTTYRIKAPDTTLAIPAQLSFTVTVPVTNGLSTMPQAAGGSDCLATAAQCNFVIDPATIDPANPVLCPADHPIFISTEYSADHTTQTQVCGLAPAAQPTLVSFAPSVVIDASSYDVSTSVASAGLHQLGNGNVGATYDTELPVVEDYWCEDDAGVHYSVLHRTIVPPAVTAHCHIRATDNVGIADMKVYSQGGVTYYPFQTIYVPTTLLGESHGPNLDFDVLFPTDTVEGTYFWEVTATDFAGNSKGLVPYNFYVDHGTSTPQGYVSLAAAPSLIVADGATTLTATTTGAVTVTKVEFFEGANKLGEDTTAPFNQVVSYTEADNGTHTYYAKATASDLTTGNSNNATVDVSIGVTQTYDLYVDASAGDDTHDGLTPGTALKTLCHAREVATAGKTIGLLDGTYDSSNQRPQDWIQTGGCGPSFSLSVNLVAVHQGQAIIEVPLSFSGGGSMSGLKLARDSIAGSGQTTITAGTFAISALSFGDLSSQPAGLFYPLTITGTATVTMTPGGVSNPFVTPVPVGRTAVFANIQGSSHVIINGMTLDDGVTDDACGAFIYISGANTLTLNGVTIRHSGQIIHAIGSAGASIAISANSVLENHSTHAGTTACNPLLDAFNTVDVTVSGSTFRGTVGGAGGSGTGLRTDGSFIGTVTLTDVTFESFTFTAAAGNALSLAGNTSATAHVNVGGTLNTFSSNDNGVYVLGGVSVSVRNSTFQNDNAYAVRASSSAGSSTVNLGQTGDLGGNVFINSTQSHVRNETTVTLNAAGNTWTASSQGADAAGHYTAQLISGPDSGANYNLTGSGTKIQF